MELIYILSIVAGSLFVLMLLIFLCMYINGVRKLNAKQNELRKMYSDKNTPKMDYDFAVYDEEVQRKLQSGVMEDGQLTIDDVMRAGNTQTVDETVFASVELEDVEEITGNYQPEK